MIKWSGQYHTRLVGYGCNKKEGIDFNENFSPIVWLTTVRVVLVMYATFDLYIEQPNVKISSLHKNLEEEIYMLKPKVFEE